MQKPNKEGWHGFVNLCKDIKDKKSLFDFFELMFTPEEIQDLSMRYLIIQALLNQELTQRSIAKELGVSIAKITRGSNEIKRSKNTLIDFLSTKMK